MPVSIVRRHAGSVVVATTVLALIALVVPAVLPMVAPASANSLTAVAAAPGGPVGSALFQASRVDLTVGESEARYKAQETLSGRGFNEAVGRTSGVQGAIAFATDGTVLADQSRIVVDLTSLKSDSSSRDGYIQRNTLQTAEFPNAIFTVTSAPGLPTPLPTSGTVSFELVGDLLVHGVSRPTTWQATATFADTEVTGIATTTVLITDFGMEPPKAGPVLTIEDAVTLELDVKGTVAPASADTFFYGD
jgi:polyisoprenoid-binding protein YceI